MDLFAAPWFSIVPLFLPPSARLGGRDGCHRCLLVQVGCFSSVFLPYHQVIVEGLPDVPVLLGDGSPHGALVVGPTLVQASAAVVSYPLPLSHLCLKGWVHLLVIVILVSSWVVFFSPGPCPVASL